MILPTITAISRNSLEAVPGVLREGAYALGATRWETIFGVLLPSAAPGIVASAILALGRALGETMAVALLIGGATRFTPSILSQSGTLASLLASKFGEAQDTTLEVLMYAAVVLMLTTLFVNLIGAWVLRIAQAKVKGLI
jgi:phosphate transport system permease protein